ncbi:hypothetical protein D3C71_1638340 [compost metagenome]
MIFQSLWITVPDDIEFVLISHFLNLNIRKRLFNLSLQGNEFSVPLQRIPQNVGEVADHFIHFVRLPAKLQRLPVQRLQRIEQEVGVHLGLQCRKLKCLGFVFSLR